MNKIISVLVGVLLQRGGDFFVDAFVQRMSTREWNRRPTTLQLARKYIVIGGNIDGIDPNKEEDTYSMSKKERRRREREIGATNFAKGKYKKKNAAANINYDKLEEKVTRERPILPREMNANKYNNSGTKSNLGVPSTRKKKVEKKISLKAARIQKQRTAGGTVDSTTETTLPQSPEKQTIEIRVAKRANKTVTMVQGTCLN